MTQTPPPDRHWGSFWLGFVAGWVAGMVAGIARAPRSGAETRALLSTRVEKLMGDISFEVERRGRQVARELERDPVQEAIDAGKAAVRAQQTGRAEPATARPAETDDAPPVAP
ncbi:MAG: YtxH domain-containing protein [Anaerolineae bacterium]|nr:YtxH domain-containing protein [Anaerolineae bacterium]